MQLGEFCWPAIAVTDASVALFASCALLAGRVTAAGLLAHADERTNKHDGNFEKCFIVLAFLLF